MPKCETAGARRRGGDGAPNGPASSGLGRLQEQYKEASRAGRSARPRDRGELPEGLASLQRMFDPSRTPHAIGEGDSSKSGDEEDSDELFELDYRVEREAVRVRLPQLLGT